MYPTFSTWTASAVHVPFSVVDNSILRLMMDRTYELPTEFFFFICVEVLIVIANFGWDASSGMVFDAYVDCRRIFFYISYVLHLCAWIISFT